MKTTTMRNRSKRTKLALLIALAILLAGAAGAASMAAASATSAKAACKLPVAPMVTHARTADRSLPKVPFSDDPSSALGSIDIAPPAPGRPCWDGQDRVNKNLIYGGHYLVVVGDTLLGYTAPDNTHTGGLRNFLVIDLDTGSLYKVDGHALAPQFNGPIQTAVISPDGRGVMVGGDFTQVNGIQRNHLAEIDFSTGAVTSWNPNANKAVHALDKKANNVLVGGAFTQIGGVARTMLASVNDTTGAVTRYVHPSITQGDPSGPLVVHTMTVSPDGLYLATTGNYSVVNGAKHNQTLIFRLGKKRAVLQRWNAPIMANNCGSGKYFSIYGSAWGRGVYRHRLFLVASDFKPLRSICDATSAWDIKNPRNRKVHPVWVNHTPGDSLSGVAYVPVTRKKGVLPVLGHQKGCAIRAGIPFTIDYSHYGICVLNAANGKLIRTWMGTTSRQVSLHVSVTWSKKYGLITAGDTQQFGGEAHNDLARWPSLVAPK
jgi:hypothetical protein